MCYVVNYTHFIPCHSCVKLVLCYKHKLYMLDSKKICYVMYNIVYISYMTVTLMNKHTFFLGNPELGMESLLIESISPLSPLYTTFSNS